MIEGLFETHINVSNLERSAQFYENVLGLELIFEDVNRRSKFYWIGERGNAMLGIREHYPTPLVQRQHFAFKTSVEKLKFAKTYLEKRGITPTNFFGEEASTLYVFCAMPAVSIYFQDPDHHSVEILAMLHDTPKPELGIIKWEEWEKIHGRSL